MVGIVFSVVGNVAVMKNERNKTDITFLEFTILLGGLVVLTVVVPKLNKNDYSKYLSILS